MNKLFVIFLSAWVCHSASASQPDAEDRKQFATEYSDLQQRNAILKMQLENSKIERELNVAAQVVPSPVSASANGLGLIENGIQLLQTDGISYKSRAKFRVAGSEIYVFEGDEIIPGVLLRRVKTTSVIVSQGGRQSTIAMTGSSARPVVSTPAATSPIVGVVPVH